MITIAQLRVLATRAEAALEADFHKFVDYVENAFHAGDVPASDSAVSADAGAGDSVTGDGADASSSAAVDAVSGDAAGVKEEPASDAAASSTDEPAAGTQAP